MPACCPALPGSLTAVPVDVVGEYRYEAREPLGGPSLPLLLDVPLVDLVFHLPQPHHLPQPYFLSQLLLLIRVHLELESLPYVR